MHLFLHRLHHPFILLLSTPRLLSSSLTPARRKSSIIARQNVTSNALDGRNSSTISLTSEVALYVLARARLGVDLFEEGAKRVDFGAELMALGLQGGVVVGEVLSGFE